ncbi:MAG: hypothetical protein NZ551_00535 [Microscillaceae bacterium]|nr:hypothetical protein [Microscillaceae bacterium]MDW8459674.1 hypothetical protein [Cytophagales bacterium]
MKKLFTQTIFFIALATFAWVGCKKDDHDHDHEHEEITQLAMTFTPISGGGPVVFQFTDPDGLGPMEPVRVEPTLRSNTAYKVTLKVMGKDKDLTDQIKKEAETHQFFFIRVPQNFIAFSYQDNDKNNLPIGLVNHVQTFGATRGVLTVVLRHELRKATANLNETNYPMAGGSTDIEASFNVVVVD